MVTPIRIGDLTIHLSQLCYARDGHDGDLHLFMACGLLTLRGAQAQVMRAYLDRHAEPLPVEPALPRFAKPQAKARVAMHKGA